jgi:hypothetical protein
MQPSKHHVESRCEGFVGLLQSNIGADMGEALPDGRLLRNSGTSEIFHES